MKRRRLELHTSKKLKGYLVSLLDFHSTKAAAIKGVLALNRALNDAFDTLESKYNYTDNTVKKKP